MTYIERFTENGPSYSADMLKERLANADVRLNLVPKEELMPIEWQDEECAEEAGIHLEPDWKLVELTLFDETKTLEIATVVSPWLHQETGKEVGRYLTIIGKPVDEKDGDYVVMGAMHPGRYEDDAPYLLINNGPNLEGLTYVPWESADAQIFLKLAEQVLPELNQ